MGRTSARAPLPAAIATTATPTTSAHRTPRPTLFAPKLRSKSDRPASRRAFRSRRARSFRSADLAGAAPACRLGLAAAASAQALPNRRHGPAGFYVNQRLIRPAIRCIGAPVAAERCSWHEAAVPRRKPAAPVRTRDVADVGDRLAAKLGRSGHAPARHDQFALTIRAVAHDRRKLVGEDPGRAPSRKPRLHDRRFRSDRTNSTRLWIPPWRQTVWGRPFCLWRALTRLERRGTAED